jgi:hypothetical protein
MQEGAVSSLCRAAIVALAIAPNIPTPALAAERVGETVFVKTAVTGKDGPLAVKSPVHRDERIRTSNIGLGQFVFKDGTKLAVGWGSSVVIDKFVYDDTRSVKKLTIRAAKGTFRWISGRSTSSAYEILTPAGTIGVRGTAFDFYIDGNGTTAVVLLNGSARFCGAGGCRQLQRRCDCVIATRNGGLTNARRVDPSIFRMLGNQRALPFLSGNQQLSRGFRATGADCGLSTASLSGKGNKAERAQPEHRDTPAPNRDRPGPPAQNRDRPDPPAQNRDRPDPPASNPDPPDEPGPGPTAPNTPDPPTSNPEPPNHGGPRGGISVGVDVDPKGVDVDLGPGSGGIDIDVDVGSGSRGVSVDVNVGGSR